MQLCTSSFAKNCNQFFYFKFLSECMYEYGCFPLVPMFDNIDK